MREAVIVSTARSPIGKAYRGSFNNTEAPTLGGHAIKHAVQRAGLEPGEVEDVIMGCALPQGSQGSNIARTSALSAGLPVSVAAMTVDRQCSSGMMAIATAAKVHHFRWHRHHGRRRPGIGQHRAKRASEYLSRGRSTPGRTA